MLSWSDTDPDFYENHALIERFENEILKEQFEKKIARLIRNGYNDDLKENNAAKETYERAYRAIGRKGDRQIIHYEGSKDMKELDGIEIRNGKPSDHANVISVMKDWWGGRDLTGMLPKVFFVHFANTTFIAEKENELIGFLVGFVSQTDQDVGYIHFVGVHSGFRKIGLGRMLYQRFFDVCKEQKRSIVKSCTSPINKLSIAFHQRIGFMIEPGDAIIEGTPVTMNYGTNNDPKVLFKKELNIR